MDNRIKGIEMSGLVVILIVALTETSGSLEPVHRTSQHGATYTITAASLSPPRFTVRAELPLADDTLRVAQSWPCDLDALCEGGWPTLIADLRVTDLHGRVLRTESIGAKGWIVRDAYDSRVLVEYSADLADLSEAGWPAPREAAFSDGPTLFTLGRPLFVGTTAGDTARIRFVLPEGVHVSVPWMRDSADGHAFTVTGFEALVNNGIVIGPQPSESITAGRFSLELALFGQWNEKRELVTQLLRAHLTTFTRLLNSDERGSYLAVFMVDSDLGGESFESSYALSASPDSAVATWGRLIGHEVFHYWNGHRIRGVDYASSQWFQEGLTEYYAIVSMARSGFMTSDEALAAFSRHLRAHRQFGKSLTASGNRKDRGFYGTATSTALVLDLMIRDATKNRRSLDDQMRQMWEAFGSKDREYTHAEVIEMMSATAGMDLSDFFQRHIEGDEPLPMESALLLAGLRLVRDEEGQESITEDPLALPRQRDLWLSLFSGRN